jgi:hypothetical protein
MVSECWMPVVSWGENELLPTLWMTWLEIVGNEWEWELTHSCITSSSYHRAVSVVITLYLNSTIANHLVQVQHQKAKLHRAIYHPLGADRASICICVLRISVPLTDGLLPRERTRSRSSCISKDEGRNEQGILMLVCAWHEIIIE